MNQIKFVYFSNREDWRKWLENNHNSEKEIWLIYFKKHTGKSRVAYNDAVEEALCFSWIDSIIKRIDDEKFAQKFTPRTNNFKWSESNINRFKKLIQEGKMTEIGLAKIDPSILKNKVPEKPKKIMVIPPVLLKILKKNKKGWDNFNNLSPSHKRLYVLWILDAKKEVTREKRLKEAIELLEQNKKLGMK